MQFGKETQFSFHDEEIKRLASELKRSCDKRGIETDSTKAAEIFHKMGMEFFERNSDKISLIKSVGLLNSAITRNPSNVSEIKKDLSAICHHILLQANAQDHNADLIAQATYVKTELLSMRSETDQVLGKLKFEEELDEDVEKHQIGKIVKMKFLQQQITAQYLQIMKNACQYCENVMGPLPCKFAFIGMGSLAKNEITPYSNFQHIILLENIKTDEDHIEFFRWFLVIFYTIILNLQETIIPKLNIEFLNDKASCWGDWFFDTNVNGISFDGVMLSSSKYPTEKQNTTCYPWTFELIKPVKKIIDYLSSDISLKSGYHLCGILTETCFMYGDEDLYKEFQNDIRLYKRSKTSDDTLNEMKQQIEEELSKVANRFKLVNLKPDGKLNALQMFHQTPTFFVTALGLICGIESASCFDMINDLSDKKKISGHTWLKLSWAVTVACEIRLTLCINAKSQRNYIQTRESVKGIFVDVLKIVKKETIIRYFQIMYCLQREVIQLLGIKETYMHSNPILMNISLSFALKLHNLMWSQMEMLLGLNSINSSDNFFNSNHTIVPTNNNYVKFDECLAELESQTKQSLLIPSQSLLISLSNNLMEVADNLYKKLQEEDLLEMFKRLVEVGLLLSQCDKELDEVVEAKLLFSVAFTNLKIANCLVELNQFEKAGVQMRRTLVGFNHQDINPENTAYFYFTAGNIWFKMKMYEASINCFQFALGISLSVDRFWHKAFDDYVMMIIHSGLGTNLLKLNQYEESQIHLKKAVYMIAKDSLEKIDYTSDVIPFCAASTLRNLGKCLLFSQRFLEAFACLDRSFEVAKFAVFDQEKNELLSPFSEKFNAKRKYKNLTNLLCDFGFCYMKVNQYKKAINCLRTSFNIRKKFFGADELSFLRVELLKCHMEIYQRERIEKHLKELIQCKIFFIPILPVPSQFLTYAYKFL